VGDQEPPDPGEFVCREAVVVSQGERLEPELARGAITFYMNTPWLVAVEALELRDSWDFAQESGRLRRSHIIP
jgi:hypothetical protein